ncbi:hypothetical protein F5Y18DRAFT_382978 [Xylariaceae sp. FL1019]|nr:hypothetical protein F5Y18DRAFT_382978 [Xylariaceae sp. FL1019]
MATSASAISFRVAHVLQSIVTGGTGGPTYVDFKIVTYASDCDLPDVCDRGLLTWEGGDLCADTADYPYNVCDRNFSLTLLDGTSACATHDANDDNNSDNIPAGNAYAQLWEGGNRIGTC